GYVVVVCGDFWQIPPVGETTVINSVMERYGKNKAKNRNKKCTKEELVGMELWKCAKVFQLEGQRRAQDCDVQKKLVELLRTRQEKTIEKEVLDLVRTLSVTDAQKDREWRFPTFLVSTNEERQQINQAVMKKFAETNGHAILRYETKCMSYEAQNNA